MAGPGVAAFRVRRLGSGRLARLLLRVCFVACLVTMMVLGIAPPR
jgi:hypothetical protein